MLPSGILPSGRSEETLLRNPTPLGFPRRSIGTGYRSLDDPQRKLG